MDGQSIFMALFGLILVGYAVMYFGGRQYLREYFQSGSGQGQGGAAGAGSPTAAERWPAPLPTAPPLQQPTGATAGGPTKPGQVLMEYTTPDSVAKGAIQSLDDYEYNLVYQNESDRALSQGLKNKLMSQRPFDWAGLPSSSSQFQAGLRESFENATPAVPDNAQPFRAINGDTMVPPDVDSVEMEERKLLQTYKPPSPEELASYSLDTESPEKLIAKLYDKKGLVPTVAHKEGTNVYEITGVRRKDEKVVYEDEEAPASVAPVQAAGEARISVPASVYDTAAARDPFYEMSPGGGKSRVGKWDYQAWTPGLERMFAPTDTTQAWY
jgi:hypothetical protein